MVKKKGTADAAELRALALADLARSGLDAKDAKRLGVEPLTADETFKLCGHRARSYKLTHPGLHGELTNYYRLRFLDEVRPFGAKKPQRYWQPDDTAPKAYLAPGVDWSAIFDDATQELWVTEGEKKAAKACKEGVPTIGFGGVWNWMSAGKPLPIFDQINLNERSVKIAFDAERQRNENVDRAEHALAQTLAVRGARVRPIRLPLLGDAEKTGLDDFLIAKGVETLLALEPETNAPTLPECLRNLKPMDPSWYTTELDPPEYVVDLLWQTEEVAAFAGQGGAGKSYVTVPMYVGIATGTPFLGFNVPKARKVMYLMCERSAPKFRRRLYKVMHYLTPKDPAKRRRFEERLFENGYPKPLGGETLNLIEFKDHQWRVSPAVDELIAEMRAAGITVLILDPISRLHGGDENDNAAIAALVRALERIVMKAGASVLFNHHTGKKEREDRYVLRGASAFNDNTSETFALTELETKSERDTLDLTRLTKVENEDGTATDMSLWEILRLRHYRASEGPRAPDAYLTRDPNTGLLYRPPITLKGAAQLGDDWLTLLVAWAKENPKPFTETKVCKTEHSKIFNGVKLSIDDAKERFQNAVTTGKLKETKQIKGHPAYRPADELVTP